MRFKEQLRSWGVAIQDRPWLFSGVFICATFVVVALCGFMLLLQHDATQKRQVWIETAYETRIDANNKLLARVDTSLSRMDVHEERGAELLRRMTDLVVECTSVVKRVGDEIQGELRSLRIAVLDSLKRSVQSEQGGQP